MTEDLSEFLLTYGGLYVPQIILIATLSAMTLYRREMSCNHCYVEPDESRHSEETAVEDTDWDDEEAEEMLASVGLYCSGASLVPILEHIISFFPISECLASSRTLEEVLDGAGNYLSVGSALIPCPPKTISVPVNASTKTSPAPILPADALLHVMSFLHPREVTNFACASRSCSKFVDEGYSSNALWKTLWFRDYGWLIHSWDVGRQAYERSACEPTFSKEFYFRFGLCCIDYVLAGQNTFDQCFVGLHGHIFDLTPFIMSHPGSPETVLVHAGRDATPYFEGVRHTMGARRLAQSLCIAVNAACVDQKRCGFLPTSHLKLGTNSRVEAPPSFLTSNTQTQYTLENTYTTFQQERKKAMRCAPSKSEQSKVLGEINVYYDPFCCRWKAWYTDLDLQTVYVDFI